MINAHEIILLWEEVCATRNQAIQTTTAATQLSVSEANNAFSSLST